MDNNTIALMLATGFVLVFIEVLRSFPAWMRVRKTRSAEGISALSTGILAGTGPGWVALAVIESSPAAAVATCVWLVFHILLCREITTVRPDLARRIILFTGISFSALVVTALIGASFGVLGEAVGVFIATATAAFSLPALWAGMRSVSTSGLSALALSVNTAEALIYFVGGLGCGGIVAAGNIVPGYILFGAIAMLCNIPRLIRVIVRRAKKLDCVDNETATVTS